MARLPATSLITQTFEGVPGGMNLALPQYEISDAECRYLQDALVDYPGVVRRRGPLQPPAGIATLSRKGGGLFVTLTPAGTDRYAVLTGDNANGYFTVLSDDKTLTLDLAWPDPVTVAPTTNPYRIVDAKPALFGGMFVGVSDQYDNTGTHQSIAFWHGGNKANYTNGSCTVARGSTALTTASGFSANVTPGMWVFANTDEPYTNAYVGCVRSVNSDTSITLMQASPYNITAKSVTFQSLRGFSPKVATGEITTATNSTIVTGGATKFRSQGLATGTWQVYRASDMAYIGKVSSVTTEISLTLTASAAVACASEDYVALRADGDYTLPVNSNDTGFLTATYAGRQWYANNRNAYETTARLWYSEVTDPEAVDLSAYDGNWIDVVSSVVANEPIRAIMGTNSGLLIFKENETFILSGSSPETFQLRKLEDDGCISGGSVMAYGAGVVWAGREGLHFFDGVQVSNVSQSKLGDYWKSTIRTFDSSKYRTWAMIARDHYFLFIENIQPTVAVIKGTTSTTPTRYTLCVNMATGAFGTMTNLNIRGAITLPFSSGRSAWYIVNDNTKAYIMDAEALFTQTGQDSVVCDGGTAGPDFYLETKKYNGGDSLRLKRFKQFAIDYLVQGDSMNVDTVLGLNNVGLTLSTGFPATVLTWDALRTLTGTWDATKGAYPTWSALILGVFQPKRVRFLKKTQFISFRLWQNSSSVANLQLGPFQIAYKLQRPGRV